MISLLYVDDEKDLLFLCKLFLERTKEFTVDTCLSATEALERLKTQRYQLILSDYQMPGMDGIEFLKEFKKISPDTPFILFTGRGREEVVVEAINNGVDSYVQKGGDPKAQFAELAHKIKKLVAQHEGAKALQVNEERLRLALHGTNDGLWDLNMQTGEMFLDEMGVEPFGYTSDDMKEYSHFWRTFIHPDDLPGLEAALSQYFHGEAEFFQSEIRIRKKSGDWVWTRVRGKVNERDASGAPLRMTGLYRDIMSQKTAEIRLVQAKKDWETIFRAIGSPVAIIGPDHTILDVNESLLTASGKSLEEIRTMKCWEIFKAGSVDHPDDCPMEKMIRTNRTESAVMQIETLGGVYLVSCTPIFDEEGRLEKAIHIATDISETIRMERDLSENRDYLGQILNSVKEGIVIIDAKTHTILDANPAAVRMIGEEKEAILHHICHEYICPNEMGKCPFTDLKQEIDNSERILLTREKKRIPIIKTVVPFSFQGKDCLLETFLDNTERSEAKENLLTSYEQLAGVEEELRVQYDTLCTLQSALTESEQKFRSLVETSPDIIWNLDPTGVIRYISPQVTTILGYTPEEITGLSLFSITPPEIHPQIRSALDDRSPVPQVLTFDTWTRHKNGSLLYLYIRSIAHHDADGTITMLSGSASDVTERKMAELALSVSDERFRQVSESAGVWIWEVDADGLYRYSSRVCEDILGYAPEELVGKKHFYDLFDPSVGEELITLAREHIREHLPFRNFPNKNVTKDGRTVILETSGLPFFDTNGIFLGFRGTDLDITDRVQTEEALRRVNAQLSLLSSITRHDILNKVSSLLGYLYLVEDEISDPLLRENLERMKSTVSSIQNQIEFTRIYQELGSHDPQWQDVALIFSRLRHPDIRMTCSVQGISIFADMMLAKVFENLLENSLMHGEKVTRISLSWEKGDGLILIWEDDGIGIAASEKEQIFERGYGQNTGLGLFMVREILSLTGIRIQETGKEGDGARFDIMVPEGAFRISS